MSAMKWTLVFVMVASTAIGGAAQQRDAAKLSVDFPVPAWPANGVVPPELKTNYVFVDLSKNQYIVAFPENLGSPNFEKDGPAERRINRYPLQRDVDPTAAVAVTSTPFSMGRMRRGRLINGRSCFPPALRTAVSNSLQTGSGLFKKVESSR
jgi:hypothetical protein